MPELSRRAQALPESAIRKLDQLVSKQRGVRFHRLNIGQPDLATPAPLLDVIGAYRPPVLAYGPSAGLPACREAAAAYYRAVQPALEDRHVAVTTGGSEALLLAMTAVGDPGDEILVPEPYYTNYNGFAALAALKIRPVRTRLDDGFALPSDAVLDTFLTPRTRAILITNPGNPTGAVYGRADVERLVAWAHSRGLFLISDEVYRRIWFEAEPASALEGDHGAEHVVCVDSTSKTWSACGLRVGFLISRNEALMERVGRLGQARLGVQPLAQEVAMAALALPESFYEEVRAQWQGRVAALCDALAALPDVEVSRPQGAFYTMVRLPVDDADAFARFLITDFRDEGESVVVAPGGGFYADPASGRDQVRLAAVTDAHTLTRAVEVLGRALHAYPGRVRRAV